MNDCILVELAQHCGWPESQRSTGRREARLAHIVTTGSRAVERQMLQSKMSSSEVPTFPAERSVAMLAEADTRIRLLQRNRNTGPHRVTRGYSSVRARPKRAHVSRAQRLFVNRKDAKRNARKRCARPAARCASVSTDSSNWITRGPRWVAPLQAGVPSRRELAQFVGTSARTTRFKTETYHQVCYSNALRPYSRTETSSGSGERNKQ